MVNKINVQIVKEELIFIINSDVDVVRINKIQDMGNAEHAKIIKSGIKLLDFVNVLKIKMESAVDKAKD